jgi:hypothetical protein
MSEKIACLKKEQLKKMAGEMKIKGRASMTMPQLKEAIMCSQNTTAREGKDSLTELLDKKIAAINYLDLKKTRLLAKELKIKNRSKLTSCDLKSTVIDRINDQINNAVYIDKNIFQPPVKKAPIKRKSTLKKSAGRKRASKKRVSFKTENDC